VYRRDGELLKGSEEFSIHEQPDGGQFIRIDYDWRDMDGTSQLVEALTDPTGGLLYSRVVAQLQASSRTKRETYDFYPDKVLIGITGGGGKRIDLEQPLSNGYIPLFLKTALLGLSIQRWPSSGTATVFGGYRDDQERAMAYDARLVSYGIEDTIHGQAQSLEIFGQEFSQKMVVLANRIIVRRSVGTLTVELTDYAHR
jgi:hypothetical protein